MRIENLCLLMANGKWQMASIGKRGALGGLDMVGMIYRIFLICIVAVGVFGLFAISYEYYVDVRDAEAVILSREISSCLVEDGVLRLDDLAGDKDVLKFCGYDVDDRFYVGVDVVGVSGDVLMSLESGDSASLWVRDLFGKIDEVSGRGGNVADNIDEIVKSNPGYYLLRHEVLVLDGGRVVDGKLSVEVLVRSEDE